MEEKKIIVSKEFVEIFKNFNVVNKVDEMKSISEKELYLLLTVCLDKHDDSQPTVVYNFQPFRDKVMEIFDVQDDKETKNELINELILETNPFLLNKAKQDICRLNYYIYFQFVDEE